MGGGKNRKNKRRRTGDNANDNGFTTTQNSGNGIPVGEDGLIPNGFTIDLGGNDFKKTSRRKSRFDDDNVDDSSEQAPRGGYGSQVLPFASDLPEDHTGEPLDGHEYLFLVRWAYLSYKHLHNAIADHSVVNHIFTVITFTSDVKLQLIQASKQQKLSLHVFRKK